MFDIIPKGFEDAVYINIEIRFHWKDRLRILFGWNATLKAQVLCQNKPGFCTTRAILNMWRQKQTKLFELTKVEPDERKPDQPL